jgi:hypothetical protein
MEKKLFETAMDKNYHEFKEAFVSMLLEGINVECGKLDKETTKEISRFGVVSETASMPLDIPDVGDASLFAIEQDDENMVLKFKMDGDEKTFPVPEQDQEFYSGLKDYGLGKANDAMKEKVSTDLNQFMKDMGKAKMEAETPDMSKLKGDERLKALKKLGEKKKLEASKKANKD